MYVCMFELAKRACGVGGPPTRSAVNSGSFVEYIGHSPHYSHRFYNQINYLNEFDQLCSWVVKPAEIFREAG